MGVDMICAQGGEGGGHTGEIPYTVRSASRLPHHRITRPQVLIPEVVEMCKTRIAPMTGKPVQVIAAGAVYNGKSLAAALSYGSHAQFSRGRTLTMQRRHRRMDWNVRLAALPLCSADPRQTLRQRGRSGRVGPAQAGHR